MPLCSTLPMQALAASGLTGPCIIFAFGLCSHPFGVVGSRRCIACSPLLPQQLRHISPCLEAIHCSRRAPACKNIAALRRDSIAEEQAAVHNGIQHPHVWKRVPCNGRPKRASPLRPARQLHRCAEAQPLAARGRQHSA